MKNILLLVVLVSGTLFGQEIPRLKLTPEGVAPVVLTFDGLSASDIYSKSLEWVQETYNNPSEVLKANIKNKKIRIDGFKEKALSFRTVVLNEWGVSYTLEISFKDEKCRFSYNINYFTGSDGSRTAITYKNFFRKNGEIRNSYISAVFSLNKSMNDLLISYYNYVSGITDAENDDW